MTLLRVLIISVLLATAACGATNDDILSSMVSGGRGLHLIETTRLTSGADGKVVNATISPDGKYVAYIYEKKDGSSLNFMKLSTGKSVPLLVCTFPDFLLQNTDSDSSMNKLQPGQEIWQITGPDIKWSPNSKLFAVTASRITGGQDKEIDKKFILVYTVGGVRKTALPCSSPLCDMIFSPDSESIAAVTAPVAFGIHAAGKSILSLHNISNQSIRQIREIDGTGWLIRLRGWADGGQSIIYSYGTGKEKKLVKQALNGGDEELISTDANENWSPNLKLNWVASDSGIVIKSAGAQNAAEIARLPKARPLGWFSNSRMLACSIPCILDDPQNSDLEHKFHQLWILAAENHKKNAMPIALDTDSDFIPSASNDGTRLIYSSKGRLYLADMEWGDPTTEEKALTGLPLSEEDEKTLIMQNAKQVGMALKMYTADYDDSYPSPGAIKDSLKNYFDALHIKELNPFMRPGTDQDIFKYLMPEGCKESDISNPAETPMGEFDAGYGWKVVVYADGHVKTVPK